ncbi:chorismate-binding protein [Algoriphagus sp. CAU 1675]|uniref:chorismate-binding protein n=1 Tax=Algoriphagus sp. CAU 1675 TaxID=3032597 RepID=UPI0023DA0AE7|nr:chorismate-binding protein [Algoriphagus sp. CAU 1675]MDF2158352.1 chorismate-binding protein [Algoriphagus sp. CAU 1675]
MIDSVSSKTYSKTEVINLLLFAGLSSGGSFALWRKPKSNVLEFILDTQNQSEKTDLNLEEASPGFIVHPFEDQEDKKAFFIQASQYLKLDLHQDLTEENLPEWVTSIISPQEVSENSVFEGLISQSSKRTITESEGDSKENFLNLVKKGIEQIKSGKLEKVVPARTKKLELKEEFNLGLSLHSMLQAYPNSFVNFFHIPQVCTWMGASPEILIETKGDYFYTMSLAGTQPSKGENPLKTAAWTQKEIEEQALVSRYIVDCFKKIRLREYEEHGPKTVMAGSLLHLRSDFKVDMKKTGFPQLGTVMLELLHPTSAVSGMPRKEAHDFLKKNEGFDRSFFAGFIGPVNISGETSIYVNLRTASFHEKEVILYAGAGVTEDSDPEKEWEETELKCQIIGKFIQNPST